MSEEDPRWVQHVRAALCNLAPLFKRPSHSVERLPNPIGQHVGAFVFAKVSALWETISASEESQMEPSPLETPVYDHSVGKIQ